MTPTLAVLYEGRPPSGDAPPILTARTVAPSVAVGCVAAVAGLVGLHAVALALVAMFSVLAMQLVAPAIRRPSFHMDGVVAELLFGLPFVLFFMPYIWWALLERPQLRWSWLAVTLGVLVGAAFQLVGNKRWRAAFDRSVLELLPPLRAATAGMKSYQYLASAVGQELFYRGALFRMLVPWVGFAVVPITTGLFVVEHIGNRWAARMHDRAYYVRIGGLAAALGALAYWTGSLWAAVLGHMVFNLVPVTQLAARVRCSRAAPAPASPPKLAG